MRKKSGAVQGSSRRAAKLIDADIGRAIRERRQALGLSQTALADKIGVSFQQVQKYEKATNRVSASTLISIAHALDCSIMELLPPQTP